MKINLKNFVKQRAQYCCEYCFAQERFSADVFSIEHIIPESKDGTTTEDNLALSCQRCNNYKYNNTLAFDPATGAMVSLYNPRTDVWQNHFKWNDNFTEILGISPIGRATVLKLKLNRDGLINLRRVLTVFNFHPPLK